MDTTKISFILDDGYEFEAELPGKVPLEELTDVLKDLVEKAKTNNE
jgi:hypothetical protein